MKDKTF